jgi:hypothetical protein
MAAASCIASKSGRPLSNRSPAAVSSLASSGASCSSIFRARWIGRRCVGRRFLGQLRKYRLQALHFFLQRRCECRHRCRVMAVQCLLQRQRGGMQRGRTQGSGHALEGVHPLPHGHMRDDVIHQVRCRLRHPARTARGSEPAPLAAERQQLVVATLAAAQPQKALRQDAAFEEGVELGLQAAPGQWPGPSPGKKSPPDCLCPGSALMNRGSSAPVLASVWAMKLAA